MVFDDGSVKRALFNDVIVVPKFLVAIIILLLKAITFHPISQGYSIFYIKDYFVYQKLPDQLGLKF